MIEIFIVLTICFNALFLPWNNHYHMQKIVFDSQGFDYTPEFKRMMDKSWIIEEQVKTPRLTPIWEWQTELVYWAEMLGVYLPEGDDGGAYECH